MNVLWSNQGTQLCFLCVKPKSETKRPPPRGPRVWSFPVVSALCVNVCDLKSTRFQIKYRFSLSKRAKWGYWMELTTSRGCFVAWRTIVFISAAFFDYTLYLCLIAPESLTEINQDCVRNVQVGIFPSEELELCCWLFSYEKIARTTPIRVGGSKDFWVPFK